MGFFKGKLKDSALIYSIIDGDEPHMVQARADMIQRLKHHRIDVFFSDTKDAVIAYEPMYGAMVPWVNAHIFSLKSIRGKGLMKFYIETGIEMASTRGTEVITIVVPQSLGLRHSMFLSAMGADKRWDVLGNMMFTVDLTQIQKYEDRLLKLQRNPEAQEAQGH